MSPRKRPGADVHDLQSFAKREARRRRIAARLGVALDHPEVAKLVEEGAWLDGRGVINCRVMAADLRRVLPGVVAVRTDLRNFGEVFADARALVEAAVVLLETAAAKLHPPRPHRKRLDRRRVP